MKRATKTDPTERKQQILDTAIWLAERVGHKNLTRDSVASYSKVSGPLVARYFKTVASLKQTVFKEAIKHENLTVLSHCVADVQLHAYPELLIKTLRFISQKL